MKLHDYANGNELWNKFLEAVPEELMSHASICRYKADSIICFRDAPVKYVHLVLSGSVSAQHITINGKVSNWMHMPSPTFIGDMEVLAEYRCYAANVSADTDCILARWSTERFLTAMMECPKLLFLVAHVVSRKSYVLSSSRGQAAFRSNLEKTVIYPLQYCEIARRVSGPPYIIQKTRAEISSEALFSQKTLDRCLFRLRDAGMVSILKGKVRISEDQLKLLEKFRDDPDSI